MVLQSKVKIKNEQNKNIKKLFSYYFPVFLIIGCLLAGCQKTIYFCETPVHKVSVNQTIATHIQPAKFYLCGNSAYPCKDTQLGKSIRHSKTSLKQFKRKSYENHVAKKICTYK